MRICVAGAGYVGLVTSACFADLGHSVVCVDADRRKIDLLADGEIPIYEPGLEALVRAHLGQRLSFSRHLAASLEGVDALFIAVGTPSRESDGWPDLSSIYRVVRDAAPVLEPGAVVVVKSTAPLGTGDEVERILREARREAEFCVVSNPEFLRAGSAVHDFQQPDRIVVGTEEPRAREMLRGIYAPLIARGRPILFTSRRSTELIKYSANALLATKIAFINEVAELCERANANVLEVARGVGLDDRIGAKFLDAGPGFGGSCFRKDALALARMGEDHDMSLRIVEAVLHANEYRKRAMVRKVAAAIGAPLRGKTIAVLGLTFKANTDDMREAPSITLISGLVEAGAQVRTFDPAGMHVARAVLPMDVAFASSAYEAARRADGLVLMTEWAEFRALDLGRIARQLNTPAIIDLRNIYDAEEVRRHGLAYYGVGRAARPAAAAPIRAPARKVANGRASANGHLRRDSVNGSERGAEWAPAHEELPRGTNTRRGV